LTRKKEINMDEIIHDLLLFLSVAVTPVIFGFLLYLGLTLSHAQRNRRTD
jgi:hypothetical protein